jgi:hypothetical protein
MRYWPSTTSRPSNGNIFARRHRKLVRNRASPHRAVEGSNKTALAMIFKLAAARAAQ